MRYIIETDLTRELTEEELEKWREEIDKVQGDGFVAGIYVEVG